MQKELFSFNFLTQKDYKLINNFLNYLKMGIKNKIKNLQIFGVGNYLPRKTHKVLLIIVLIGISLILGKVLIGNNSATTGKAISDIEIEGSNNQPNTNEDISNGIKDDSQNTGSKQDSSNKEENTQNDKANYEVYEYYEYGGQCSYDIKKAEDNVNDVLSYLDDSKNKYTNLEKEYNDKIQEYTQKLEALKDEYEPKIQNAKEESDTDQKDLKAAQERLQSLQKYCAF